MRISLSSICFQAEKGFSEFDDSVGSTFLAGYGRRRVPHCFTDDKGPEPFEVCGRPIWCTKDARTTKCGISFKYNVRLFENY